MGYKRYDGISIKTSTNKISLGWSRVAISPSVDGRMIVECGTKVKWDRTQNIRPIESYRKPKGFLWIERAKCVTLLCTRAECAREKFIRGYRLHEGVSEPCNITATHPCLCLDSMLCSLVVASLWMTEGCCGSKPANARIKNGCGSRFNQQHCLWCKCAPTFDLHV